MLSRWPGGCRPICGSIWIHAAPCSFQGFPSVEYVEYCARLTCRGFVNDGDANAGISIQPRLRRATVRGFARCHGASAAEPAAGKYDRAKSTGVKSTGVKFAGFRSAHAKSASTEPAGSRVDPIRHILASNTAAIGADRRLDGKHDGCRIQPSLRNSKSRKYQHGRRRQREQ